MTTNRRAFLKIAGALGVVCYAEPLLAIEPEHDWVQDKGSYLLVRIPDGKTFANETFTKPAVILMGAYSEMRDIRSNSYANIACAGGNRIRDLAFDCRGMMTEKPRSIILVRGDSYIVEGAHFQLSQYATSAIEVEESRGMSLQNVQVTTPAAWVFENVHIQGKNMPTTRVFEHVDRLQVHHDHSKTDTRTSRRNG